MLINWHSAVKWFPLSLACIRVLQGSRMNRTWIDRDLDMDVRGLLWESASAVVRGRESRDVPSGAGVQGQPAVWFRPSRKA